MVFDYQGCQSGSDGSEKRLPERVPGHHARTSTLSFLRFNLVARSALRRVSSGLDGRRTVALVVDLDPAGAACSDFTGRTCAATIGPTASIQPKVEAWLCSLMCAPGPHHRLVEGACRHAADRGVVAHRGAAPRTLAIGMILVDRCARRGGPHLRRWAGLQARHRSALVMITTCRTRQVVSRAVAAARIELADSTSSSRHGVERRPR